MASGDPRGLEGAYRRYADRLYAYCRGLLRDGDAASDIVHDTFLIASRRAGDIREPDRLQAWLYTVARRECLRVLRAQRRTTPLAEFDEPAIDPTDPGRAVQAAQVRELVATAATGLSDGDREIIELAVRHDMSAADVAAVLGVGANHAHARISRARTQLLRSLGALLMARSDPAHCDELADLVRGWNGQFTPLLRKRVSRHIERCPRCTSRQAQLLNPAHLLPAYAALPFLAVPAIVWPRLSPPAPSGTAPAAPSDATPPGGTTGREGPTPGQPGNLPVTPISVGRAPLPVSPITGPRPPRPERDRRPLLVVAVALLVLMVLGAGVGLGLARLNPAGDPSQASTDRPEPGLTPGGGGPAEPTPTPSTPATTPPTAGPPTPPPTSLAPLVFTAATTFTVTADGDPVCVSSGVIKRFRIDVTAQANATLDRALLYWTAPLDRDPMAPTGPRSASGSTESITGSVATWWVEAVAADGRKAETAPVTVVNPC